MAIAGVSLVNCPINQSAENLSRAVVVLSRHICPHAAAAAGQTHHFLSGALGQGGGPARCRPGRQLAMIYRHETAARRPEGRC